MDQKILPSPGDFVYMHNMKTHVSKLNFFDVRIILCGRELHLLLSRL